LVNYWQGLFIKLNGDNHEENKKINDASSIGVRSILSEAIDLLTNWFSVFIT